MAGGAHVLDVCVALTERQDEGEQMRQVVKRISLTQPAPIQIDSTEPEVIETALQQIPGRAIVNSVNLEAGRDKLDRVVPLAKAHGAALIALTIDEVGMAKTAQRKLEIAQRIRDLCCEEHGLDPEVLIFDCLTFTLTTGDEEWRPSAVETIEGIRAIKAGIPGVKTSLGVSNVSFGVGVPARSVLNSVFLHHCVQAGLDLAMVNPNHITPYAEIPEAERELADDLVFNRREDALERFIGHFESKGADEETSEKADPTEGMEPEEALHFHILRRKREGVEDWIDRCNEKIGAVPTLNTVLLPAMKEVGDKFGAGELILPFVLQSAEVMKRAVARLELYLDKLEGYTKGTVVLATVFGDVHDIGKSLVNTILTNNGYTVVDLGKQVPISTILDAAVEHDATAIGLSALLVSTSKQMPACVQELHERGLEFPVLIGGAAINRNFGLRILYPRGPESDDVYEPGVFFCKDAFEGLAKMDQLIDEPAREALVNDTRSAARRLREQPDAPADDAPPVTDDSVRSAVRTDNPIPEPPFWGVREIDVPLHQVYHHLDTHVLFKLHWGGRGVKGEAWRELLRDDFQPRLERMWREQTYLHPRAVLGYFPCNSEGNELIVWDPEAPTRRRRAGAPGVPPPAAARPHLPGRLLPESDPAHPEDVDVVALQAVTAGDEVTELMARLEAEGEFAEQLFVHGLGVQTAEGMAEWLHARVRHGLGIEPTQGRRYSWGYPACPEQSEHEKVFRLLDAPQIGLRLSGGFAVEPEQSTLAIVAHHPQAVYFGTKSGFLPQDAEAGFRRRDQGHRARPQPTGRAARRRPGLREGRLRRGRRRAGHGRRLAGRRRLAFCLGGVPPAGGAARWARGQLHRRGVHRAQADLAPGHALLEQRGHPHQHGGRDLDRLQDHAVGHAVAVADVPAGVQDGRGRRLEDAEVGRGGGQHGGDVDGEQNRGGGGEPGLVLEPQRVEQDVAGQPLQAPRGQLGEGGDRPEPRTAEHGQPGAHAGHRLARLGQRHEHPRGARAAGTELEHDRHQQHRHQQGHRGDRRHQQRRLMTAEQIDRGEHDRAEHGQRHEVEQRLGDERAEHHRQVLARAPGPAGDHQRPRGLAEPRRQRR